MLGNTAKNADKVKCVTLLPFPECVARDSKGSRFILGRVGVELCSPDVAFTSATVRNRSREGRMAMPMGSSAKGVTFGDFPRRIASFRAAGVALCDIPRCFKTCQKS